MKELSLQSFYALLGIKKHLFEGSYSLVLIKNSHLNYDIRFQEFRNINCKDSINLQVFIVLKIPDCKLISLVSFLFPSLIQLNRIPSTDIRVISLTGILKFFFIQVFIATLLLA